MKPDHFEYRGFGHFPIPRWLLWMWRKLLCKRGIHLWDEVLSSAGGKEENGGWRWYFCCDACQIEVNVEGVNTTYQIQ